MQFCLLCAALAFGSCTKDDGPSSQSLIDSRTKPMQEGTWEMIPELSDEFDGTSLNSDKWLDYHPYWAGRSPSKFVRENVKVEDGYLKLVASYDPDDYELWINSACVSSKEESCDYGYYEARIKVHGLSLSGSFWFQNEADPETNYDQLEIDYENVGDSKLYQQHSYASMITLHWGENWGANSYTVWDPYGEDRKCSDDFFIYGVEYGRDEIKMFINKTVDLAGSRAAAENQDKIWRLWNILMRQKGNLTPHGIACIYVFLPVGKRRIKAQTDNAGKM